MSDKIFRAKVFDHQKHKKLNIFHNKNYEISSSILDGNKCLNIALQIKLKLNGRLLISFSIC